MKPKQLQFMTRLARHAGGVLLGLISIAGLAPAAHAEDVEICANRYVNVNDFEVLPCTDANGETFGSLRMLSPTSANLEVRHVEGLFCESDGLDVSFTIRGSLDVTAEEGYRADCFRQQDGTCYTAAPIRFVGLTCFIKRP